MSVQAVPTRVIAVIHRVKKTVDNEARPTILSILEGEKFTNLVLETEREEFDFLTSIGDYAEMGLKQGDLVITMLGGSGDRLSFAMSRQLEECGGMTYRIPAFRMRDFKKSKAFEELDPQLQSDVAVLHTLWQLTPEHFFECRVRDREIIRISELYRCFKDAQIERMKCANRLRSRLIGGLFLSEEGKYPEGKIEDWFRAQKATDAIYVTLEKEEETAKSVLDRALKKTRISDIFDGVTGCGPSIIGGLISTIVDIRRFERDANLVSYMGLSVLKENGEKAQKGEQIVNGLFPRQRRGMRTSWNRVGRQTLYTLADQFNRRPESEWGKRLLANKEYYRARHPHTLLIEKYDVLVDIYTDGEVTGWTTVEKERAYPLIEGFFEKKASKYLVMDPETAEVTEVRGKLRYYPGHIHKMAIWKTLREFVLWLHGAWTEFEKTEYQPKVAPKRGRAQRVVARKAA